MFSLKDFVMKTLGGMKRNYPEFQVREFALKWYANGVLSEDDLATIEAWYSPIEEAPAVEETEAIYE